MAMLHGREDIVPLPFNVRTVGVQLPLEARFGQDPLRARDIFFRRGVDHPREKGGVGPARGVAQCSGTKLLETRQAPWRND